LARIALDAMGGDNAPIETVAGAIDAAARGVEVILVGDRGAIEAELAKQGAALPVIDAPDVIGMGDDPARALREKPGASINVAARLVEDGQAEGLVSAGSTGAAMAAAAIHIGRIKGVTRPSIASIFPTPGSPTLVLDSGANPDVKAEVLVQFAIMGSVAAEVLLGAEDPRVGLLSIGEERGKGRDLERDAYELFEAAPIRFVGNVEGRDVAADKADVIVTDGFTGNIFLKTMEGAAQVIMRYALEAISDLEPSVQDSVLPALGEVKRKLDYETYGGAHLLGVKGAVVIAHGASSRVAIANALAMASDAAAQDLPGRMSARLTS
jgi:glycerol-3-phosphate acyltransferase PlsX